jgi:DNA-binding MarR family transcriptional regulator
MSRRSTRIPPIASALERDGPYVGALLRMAYAVSRERSLDMLVERGFTDLNQALLGGFFWPPPDGARPIDLAERANVTKQAMNYIIGELEKLGYMERRSERPGGRRLVYLTRRGWRVFAAIWTAQRELQAEWAAALGRREFAAFMSGLRRLSGFDATREGGRRQRPTGPHARGKSTRRKRR